MASININTDAVVKFTDRLERLSRSGMPVAIRQTLNRTAKDMKQRSLLAVTGDKFTIRKKNFFKAFSAIQFATGFDIKQMQSVVGILAAGNAAAEDLEKQEVGGKIGGRAFIPTDKARVGKKSNKAVSAKRTLKNFKKMKRVGWGDKKGFLRVLSKTERGGAIIYGSMVLMVTGRQKKGGRMFAKTEKIYSFKRGRSVRVKPTFFMKTAALISSNRMELIYKQEAEKQVNRILKR